MKNKLRAVECRTNIKVWLSKYCKRGTAANSTIRLVVTRHKKSNEKSRPETTKYTLVSCYQKAGQRQNIKVANRSCDNVEKFKYWWTTLADQNCIHEEIKSRLQVKIYKTIILPVVLYGCETWSLTLREKHMLRVFEKKILRRIFDLRRMWWRKNGRNCTVRNFIICTHLQISIGGTNGKWGRQGMWHAWERKEKCTRFWCENQKERGHLEDQGVGGRMASEWILER
jgi:hypothetical protein